MKNYKEILNLTEKEEDIKFSVVLKGGSIGGKPSIKSPSDLKGQKVQDLNSLFDDKAEAQKKAKRMNKLLSPGEKKYYSLKYIIAQVQDGKWNGK